MQERKMKLRKKWSENSIGKINERVRREADEGKGETKGRRGETKM